MEAVPSIQMQPKYATASTTIVTTALMTTTTALISTRPRIGTQTATTMGMETQMSRFANATNQVIMFQMVMTATTRRVPPDLEHLKPAMGSTMTATPASTKATQADVPPITETLTEMAMAVRQTHSVCAHLPATMM